MAAIPGFHRGLIQAPQQQQVTQPGQTNGSFAADLLPVGGGIGGALAGAAAGAGIGSIFPGLGTVVGGLIGGVVGGAGGSAAGQFAKNGVTGEKDLSKGVANEALLGGLTSAPPLRLLRGASAAGKVLLGAGKVAGSDAVKGAATGAAKTAFENAFTSPGLISTAGATLRGEARGVGIGDKVAGGKLDPAQAKQLNDFLENTVKVKGGSAAKQLESVDKFITDRSDQLSKAISTSNRSLTAAERKTLSNDLTKQFSTDIIAPTSRQQAILSDITTRIGQTKDVAGLDALRKQIDESINFARSSASPEPAAEQIFKLARTHLTDAVASRVSAAKTLKSDLSNAFDAKELLLNKASGGGGYARAGSGGIATIPIPRRATQAAENALGKVMGKAGTQGGGFTPTAVIARNAVERPIAGLGQQPDLTNAVSQASPGYGQGQIGQDQQATTGFGGQSGFGVEQPQSQQDPYPQENLLYDIQRDPNNADKYFAYYQNVQKVINPNGNAKPQAAFSRPSAQLYSQATTGLQSIDQLEGILSKNPDIVNKNATPGQDLPVIGGLVSNAAGTNQYRAAANNILNSIARINTGAAMPASEEAFYARTYLPQPGDPPATQAQKIAALRQFFSPIANYQDYSGQDTSLQDALLQQSQGGF